MMFRTLLLLSLFGCNDGDSGVSVGNPNKDTLLRIGPPGDDITLDLATVGVASIVLVGADGEVSVDPPSETDVLAGVTLDLPAGDWMSVSLGLTGALTLVGLDGEGVVDVQLSVPEVSVVAMREAIELGEPHVFELGFPGWLSAEEVGWGRGTDHIVREGDVEHDVLVGFVSERSALHADLDGDGEPDR